MIINGKTLNDLKSGFNALYLQGQAEVQSNVSKVAMIVPSSGPAEKYGWMANMPRMRKWLGDRVLNNVSGADFTIKNEKFESTVVVSASDIEDDTLGQYAPMFQSLGNLSQEHPDELVFALMQGAFTSLCYDGQYFIDTDHPVLDKNGAVTSASNSGGGASTPWFLLDTRKAIKPFIFQKRRDYRLVSLDKPEDQNAFMRDEYIYGVDARVNAGYGLWQLAYGSKQALDETNYGLARANLSGRVGDYGKSLRLQGNLLVVPPSLESAALKIVTAQKNAAGADNIYAGTAEVLVVSELGL